MMVELRDELKCEAPVWVRLICVGGQRVNIQRGCGRCAKCMNDWRLKVKHAIREGVERGGEYQFVTLTFLGGTASVGQASAAWRRFRRKYKGLRFYRVFEPHKRGGIHIHAVVEKRFPTVPDLGKAERLGSWKRRLTPEAREFVEGLRELGFGPVCSV